MPWTRPRLALVASAWLVFQLGLLVSIPTALCPPKAPAAVGVECTCEHGDGQMCPMHHTRSKASSAKDSHPCTCRGTTDPAAAMAASLIGPVGMLSPSTAPVARATVVVPLPAFAPAPLDSFVVPDSPPPRS
jgi:hypothetical protein